MLLIMSLILEQRLIRVYELWIGDVFMSLDVTDSPKPDPKPFSSQWFCHKMIGVSLSYEKAVLIGSDDIV